MPASSISAQLYTEQQALHGTAETKRLLTGYLIITVNSLKSVQSQQCKKALTVEYVYSYVMVQHILRKHILYIQCCQLQLSCVIKMMSILISVMSNIAVLLPFSQ